MEYPKSQCPEVQFKGWKSGWDLGYQGFQFVVTSFALLLAPSKRVLRGREGLAALSTSHLGGTGRGQGKGED